MKCTNTSLTSFFSFSFGPFILTRFRLLFKYAHQTGHIHHVDRRSAQSQHKQVNLSDYHIICPLAVPEVGISFVPSHCHILDLIAQLEPFVCISTNQHQYLYEMVDFLGCHLLPELTEKTFLGSLMVYNRESASLHYIRKLKTFQQCLSCINVF